MRMADKKLGEFFIHQNSQLEVAAFNVLIKLASITRRHHYLHAIRSITRPKRFIFFFRQRAQRRQIEHALAGKGGAHRRHFTHKRFAG